MHKIISYRFKYLESNQTIKQPKQPKPDNELDCNNTKNQTKQKKQKTAN